MSRIALISAGFCVACLACAGSPDAAPDGGTSSPDAGTTRRDVQEQEPNGGATLTEVNAIALGDTVHGAIGEPGDADVFHFDSEPGHLYRVTIHAPAGSTIDGRITVFDSGRDGHAAGEDFVKLARSPTGPDAALEFLAMGAGGHFLAVRDTRGTAGAPTATYELEVAEVDRATRTSPIAFPSTADDSLADPGAVRLYSFSGTEGTNVRLDLQAKAAQGGLDGRLFVYSAHEGSWIARNQDRSASDANPLIDAPLTASGDMLLVVDNIDEGASDLRYTLSAASE